MLNQLIYALLILGSIISYSCKTTKGNVMTDQGEQIKIDTSDCFPDRKSQDTIDLNSGTVTKIFDQYYISSSENNNRFIACNMPAECESIDMKVRCQLVIKEIYPYERRAGTPVVLRSISILEP